jgi:GNAT superfamily N-acetyltransferase
MVSHRRDQRMGMGAVVSHFVKYLGLIPKKGQSMFEVAVDHPGLAPLFDPTMPNHPVLLAILGGDNPGRAFVDQVENPAHAIIRTQDGWAFFSQHAPQAFFDAGLEQLRSISHVILIWPSTPTPATPPAPDHIIQRLEFSAGAAGDGAPPPVPAGLTIRPMDRALLADCEWGPAMELACGSLEAFLAHGIGLCLLRGDAIIAEAYAPFRGISTIELGAVTREADRGHGYAALLCAHLIPLCRERGLAPYWSCDADNVASIKLAQRLGFVDARPYAAMIYRSTKA